MPQIEVTFDIDANGILHVVAKDLGTSKEQSIKVTASNKLSKEDVEKFVKQAEQFADADKKKKEEIEVKNEADTAVYATEKALKEHGDKISQDERLKIEQAINDAKEALKGSDLEKIKQAKEAVLSASHKLAEQIYQEAAAKAKTDAPDQSAPGASGNGGGQDQGKDKVVDAEVVDNDKK